MFTEECKNLIIDGKKYLENDDLKGFYSYLFNKSSVTCAEIFWILKAFIEWEIDYIEEIDYADTPEQWLLNKINSKKHRFRIPKAATKDQESTVKELILHDRKEDALKAVQHNNHFCNITNIYDFSADIEYSEIKNLLKGKKVDIIFSDNYELKDIDSKYIFRA